MRLSKKTALVALLGMALTLSPAMAHAGWRRDRRAYFRPYFAHRYVRPSPPVIGLSIAAGAVVGTVALVDSIIRAPFVAFASPPPPPAPPRDSYDDDDAYRRGYDDGRRDRDSYDDDADRSRPHYDY